MKPVMITISSDRNGGGVVTGRAERADARISFGSIVSLLNRPPSTPSWQILKDLLHNLHMTDKEDDKAGETTQNSNSDPTIIVSNRAISPVDTNSAPPEHLLPPQKKGQRKTLVLDLDATLIDTVHIHQQGSCEPDFVYTDSEGCRAKIWKRPHLMEFLEAVSKDFEVVLFTAAGQRHADAVLSWLDPAGTLVEHRLYGQHTVAVPSWSWVKDLGRLGRDLSQTLIVDDCEAAALFHRANWVSIPAFCQFAPQWRTDNALLDILHFLQDKVLHAEDVRSALADHYNQAARKPFGPADPAATLPHSPEGGSLPETEHVAETACALGANDQSTGPGQRSLVLDKGLTPNTPQVDCSPPEVSLCPTPVVDTSIMAQPKHHSAAGGPFGSAVSAAAAAAAIQRKSLTRVPRACSLIERSSSAESIPSAVLLMALSSPEPNADARDQWPVLQREVKSEV